MSAGHRDKNIESKTQGSDSEESPVLGYGRTNQVVQYLSDKEGNASAASASPSTLRENQWEYTDQEDKKEADDDSGGSATMPYAPAASGSASPFSLRENQWEYTDQEDKKEAEDDSGGSATVRYASTASESASPSTLRENQWSPGYAEYSDQDEKKEAEDDSGGAAIVRSASVAGFDLNSGSGGKRACRKM